MGERGCQPLNLGLESCDGIGQGEGIGVCHARASMVEAQGQGKWCRRGAVASRPTSDASYS
jgi:hypothetical protein